ncbi:MAG: TIGR02266 family protein [Nitrospiraceae bacterium]|nr:TIGR02266 family protein [Nitrospiraceae bacterium]
MRLPVIATVSHKGKALELDCERETITVRGAKGENLGTMTWSSIIEQARSIQESERIADTRNEPRLSLVLKVRYSTNGGKSLESRAGGIGGGGLFIESTAPLPVGTDLAIEFALPDSPSEWMHAKGTVAWVCPKSDQYTFSPGMGVRFVDIAAESRGRVLQFVNSMKRAGR